MSETTSAEFSPCGAYRYELRRIWEPCAPLVAFCGLNPSTADATLDDPTVRRWRGFAKSWGYGGFVVVNAYALRSTDPKGLRRVSDPVGLANDQAIIKAVRECAVFVACWGVHVKWRQNEIRRLLRSYHFAALCFGVTKHGYPKHPLYLPNDAALEPWA